MPYCIGIAPSKQNPVRCAGHRRASDARRERCQILWFFVRWLWSGQ